jgi:hypothetical protein
MANPMAYLRQLETLKIKEGDIPGKMPDLLAKFNSKNI